MEMRCSHKILRISYKDRVTNEEVCAKIQQAIAQHEDLLTIVKRRKLKSNGHASVRQIWPKASNHLARHSERGEEDKAARKRGKHQGMDRHGVHQVPEDSGERRKMKETGC